jgi:PhnB protein
MSVTTTTHINFRGDARKALEFYQLVFGGDLSIATYADIHSVEDPAQTDQVAFGRVTAPNGFDIMAYDVQPSKSYDPGQNAFYVTLQGTNAEEITAVWDALVTGWPRFSPPSAPPPSRPSTACSPTVSVSPGSWASTPPGATDHPRKRGVGRWPAPPSAHQKSTRRTAMLRRLRRARSPWSERSPRRRSRPGARVRGRTPSRHGGPTDPRCRGWGGSGRTRRTAR